MSRLPEKFVQRMKEQLPQSEWAVFFACYEGKPYKGIRNNPLKGDRYALKALLPFVEEPVPWEGNGYYVAEEKVGGSPLHAAGAFYSQEPSAMSAAPLLEVKKGERVLDLCSAPGGKGTQLACAMAGEGIIVLNEPIASRAKILSQNVERMGIKNAVVTNAYPEGLATRFQEYFDKILVDAPCSGEGMFRKNADEALTEWSEENVALCASRQAFILEQATKMLKKGGRLVYSTCTFSKEEDEGQIAAYLEKHPEMRLCKEEKLYPHRIKGEGHFVALLEKTEKGAAWECRLKEAKYSVTAKGEKAYRGFERSVFKEKFARRLYEKDGTLYELPQGVFDWSGLQVLRVGVRLGEIRGERFEPNHSLAMCLRAEECQRVLNLGLEDERVGKYLSGEVIEGDLPPGWCLVCVAGYPIGWGKCVEGKIKNHLPKALRLAAVIRG